MGKKARIRKLKKKVARLKARLAAAQTHTFDVSPLAPVGGFPDLPVINGVRFASAQAGVKYAGRSDVMLALMDAGTRVAGVFTRSATRSANVLDCQEKIGADSDAGAAIIVNSGNSNAFTGRAGEESVAAICKAVAEATGVPEGRVFTSSTGVIGERLPHDRIIAKIDELAAGLEAGGAAEAARAIMTTDTFPKGASAEVSVGGKPVKIAGFAKGSGMIAPDMATMLVYIFTDAEVSPTRPIRSARRCMVSCLTLPNRLCATAKGRRSLSRCVFLARDRTSRHGFMRSPSPIRRWSRRPLRAKTRIGGASSWPSASPVPPPIATS